MKTKTNPDVDPFYQDFLQAPTASQWKRFGTSRRSGVATPLFSLYSSQSTGIGEIPDLQLLVDWCRKTGLSVIQLLPMNDVGFDFRPYDAQSTFALEPVYLDLNQLAGVTASSFLKEITDLKRRFPCGGLKVNYGIKAAKLKLLKEIFDKSKSQLPAAFESFVKKNNYWLNDYVLFKAVKESTGQAGWESWPAELRDKNETALHRIEQDSGDILQFHRWLQWQLFEQFAGVKQYANKKGVLLMGDLPFLVSRDSADVWAHQNYFKLELSSGAPPDMYFAKGQRWGMPPYRWQEIEAHGFDYLIQKLKYAENFYDMFRIDHVVGMFRVWTIRRDEPEESGGLNGSFDPAEESVWEAHGRKLLEVMIQNTAMLPCAEDLGTVPPCSYRVLSEFGIPGIDVQRWIRYWGASFGFREPAEYRKNSMAVIATHDSSSLAGWWLYEAGTIDEMLFERKCGEHGIPYAAVRGGLFDLEKSRYGRMRWKKEISTSQELARIVERPEGEIGDLVELYRGSVDEKEKFLEYAALSGGADQPVSPEFARAAIQKSSDTAAVFSIQLLQDWFSLEPVFECDVWNYRINFPGTTNQDNWTLVIPVPLEDFIKLPVNETIRTIIKKSGRLK